MKIECGEDSEYNCPRFAEREGVVRLGYGLASLVLIFLEFGIPLGNFPENYIVIFICS